MARAGEVQIAIEARMDRFDRDLRTINNRLAKFDADATRGMRNVERAAGLATRAVGVLAAALSAREVVQAADSVNLLRGRIGLYADSAAEASAITANLFDVARETGVAFNSLAETYARLAPAQDRLNLSNQRMLELSEAIGASFRVSGASAQEAGNAIIQLSQAFASGELRGEELRSVMEQGQRIMIALQNQTGKTTGELREMAEAGQLTADVVANALLAELPQLRQELEDLPDTVGVGFERLVTATVELTGELDRMTGASGSLADALTGVANAIGHINDRLADDPQRNIRAIGAEAGYLAGIAAALNIVMGKNFISDAASDRAAAMAQSSRSLAEGLDRVTESAIRAEMMLEFARGETDASTPAVVELSDSVQGLVNRLEMQRVSLKEGRVAAALYAAEVAKGAELTRDEASAVREAAEAIDALNERREESEAVERAAADRVRENIRNQERLRRLREGAAAEYRSEFGADDPLSILQDERDRRLEIIREAQDFEIISEETFQRRLSQINREYSAERNQIMLSSASQGFASLAQIIGAAAGETSAAYRVLFGISKGFAIAESVIAIQQSIAKAAALGFPQNIPIMASAAAQGASIIQTITSTEPRGFEQGGLVTGGRQMIQINEAGEEFVTNAVSTRRFRPQLEAMNQGQNPFGGVNIQVINNASGVRHEVRQMGPNDVRIICREEVAKGSGPAVAREMDNPNSTVSKGLRKHVQADRRRD